MTTPPTIDVLTSLQSDEVPSASAELSKAEIAIKQNGTNTTE